LKSFSLIAFIPYFVYSLRISLQLFNLIAIMKHRMWWLSRHLTSSCWLFFVYFHIIIKVCADVSLWNKRKDHHCDH
jgi:hypothetical protein